MNKSAIQKKKEGKGKKKKKNQERGSYFVFQSSIDELKGHQPAPRIDGRSLLSLAAGDPL